MENIAALFRRLTTGVHVIGVAQGEHRNAFTAAWVVQTSFHPLLLALSINPEHASYGLLKNGGGFTVNVLRRGQLALARHFGTSSGRDIDKLAQVRWRPGKSGAPILLEGLAYLDCRLERLVPAGDHELALGEVIDGAILAPDAMALTYAETGDLDGSSELYPTSFPGDPSG
jgi:flavin reductase (DIM6/NTAB) family NADH-FMN oxidoreductase RutF